MKGALEALHDELGVKRTQSLQLIAPYGDEGYPGGQLTGDAIAVMVAHKLPENSIVCEEAITSVQRFFALLTFAAPHDFIMPTGGAIGAGIPLATGAAIGCPDRKVINLQADGSAMYTVQGLWTQARENLDVTTIILPRSSAVLTIVEFDPSLSRRASRSARRLMSLRIRLATGFADFIGSRLLCLSRGFRLHVPITSMSPQIPTSTQICRDGDRLMIGRRPLDAARQ